MTTMKRNDLVVGQTYAVSRHNDYLDWSGADRAIVVDATTRLVSPKGAHRVRTVTLADGTEVRTSQAAEATSLDKPALVAVRLMHVRSTWEQYVQDRESIRAAKERVRANVAAATGRYVEAVAAMQDRLARNGITSARFERLSDAQDRPYKVTVNVEELERLLAIADQAAATQSDEPRAHGGTIHATQVTASCSVDELRATLRYLGVEFHDHLNRIDTSGPFPSVVMPDREAETLCRELRSVGIAFNLRGTTLTNIPAR
jgi:hypothetical protein